MTISLTTPIALLNCQRWQVIKAVFDEDALKGYVTLRFLTSPATANVVQDVSLTIENGTSQRASRYTPVAGEAAAFVVTRDTVSTPAGYTNAFAAYTGASVAARRAALETHLLSAGIVNANLTGT